MLIITAVLSIAHPQVCSYASIFWFDLYRVGDVIIQTKKKNKNGMISFHTVELISEKVCRIITVSFGVMELSSG